MNAPGWKTTEWWTTLTKLGLSLLITLGVVTRADAGTLEGALSAAVVASFALASNAWAVAQYVKGRSTVKEAAALAAPAAPQGVPHR